MDDLIVIILTLIIAGFGVLGQIKKKKEVQQPAAPPQPDDIWDLIQAKREEQVQETSPYTEITEDPESAIESFSTRGYQFDPQLEGESSLKDRIKPIPPVREKVKTNKMGFSLKKAVIYSAILNRKYI